MSHAHGRRMIALGGPPDNNGVYVNSHIPAAARIHDAIIIGGGPAGLACAKGLGRLEHSVIVFDDNRYDAQNAAVMHQAHGFDSTSAEAFRDEISDAITEEHETVRLVQYRVTEARNLGPGRGSHGDFPTRFTVMATDGKQYWCRKLIIATGTMHEMYQLPNYKRLWGKHIHNNLLFQGFEKRGLQESVGILAMGGRLGGPSVQNQERVAALARSAARLADYVTIYTDGDEGHAAGIRARLHRNGPYRLVTRPIVYMGEGVGSTNANPYVTVKVATGEERDETFLVHDPVPILESPVIAMSLRLQVTRNNLIHAPMVHYQSTVAGVYAIGDCADPLTTGISNACAMGNCAAEGISHALLAEDEAIDDLYGDDHMSE
ncbi:hypothetical protein F4677DRAFT_461782 [Hypoxylon crocopeplum]|nr:hypothetical protein F4677DRAFT_461782 [Hypoxylon crocopeplum]